MTPSVKVEQAPLLTDAELVDLAEIGELRPSVYPYLAQAYIDYGRKVEKAVRERADEASPHSAVALAVALQLERHNLWRRGGDTIEDAPSGAALGRVIDVAVGLLRGPDSRADEASGARDAEPGCAVLVGGSVVAWFADADAAEEWGTKNHFGQWLTWRSTAPVPIPLTAAERADCERRARELHDGLNIEPGIAEVAARAAGTVGEKPDA